MCIYICTYPDSKSFDILRYSLAEYRLFYRSLLQKRPLQYIYVQILIIIPEMALQDSHRIYNEIMYIS